MTYHPRKFTLDDDEYFPCNLSKDERERRFYGRDAIVYGPGAAAPFVPTTIPQLDRIVHELTQLLRVADKAPAKRFKSISGAILLSPPGMGKTTIIRALRAECDRYTDAIISFFDVKLALILDGNPLNNITKIYQAAEMLKPSLVFCDEFNGLFKGSHADSLQEVFKCILDGFTSLSSVFTVVAANDISSINEALLRRGRLELVYELTVPLSQERRLWLNLLTKTWDLTADFLKDLTKNTKRFSPAELSALCRDAEMLAIVRLNESMKNTDSATWSATNGAIPVNAADLTLALNNFKSSETD